MTIKPHSITFDSTEPLRLARWWAEQTGGEITAENEGYFVTVALPDGPSLAFQKVDDPTPGKNRLHLDCSTVDVEATKDALVAAGATHVHDKEMGGFRWTTLADPDGNQFCIASAG